MFKKGLITILSMILLAPLLAQESKILFHSDFEKAAFLKNRQDPFELLIASDPSIAVDKYNSLKDDFNSLEVQLQELRNKTKTESEFLEKVFYKVHRKKLGWYENYISFSKTLEEKKYDCLTGSALFALLLQDLGIEYQILEFDFHIVLLASVDDGKQIMIEATDPFDGFVTDESEIKNRIEKSLYSLNVSADYIHSQTNNEITLIELAGLQYFNLAVDLFNKGQYKFAKEFIMKAEFLYPSERIQQTEHLISSASL